MGEQESRKAHLCLTETAAVHGFAWYRMSLLVLDLTTFEYSRGHSMFARVPERPYSSFAENGRVDIGDGRRTEGLPKAKTVNGWHSLIGEMSMMPAIEARSARVRQGFAVGLHPAAS